MNWREAETAILKKYNNKVNAMTPYIIEYGKAGIFYYEISCSTDETLFGVTVLPVIDPFGLNYSSLGECFFSLKDALNYIKELENGYPT